MSVLRRSAGRTFLHHLALMVVGSVRQSPTEVTLYPRFRNLLLSSAPPASGPSQRIRARPFCGGALLAFNVVLVVGCTWRVQLDFFFCFAVGSELLAV